MRYESYGNVAYAPAYEGDVAALPRQREESIPLPRRRAREQEQVQEQTLTRTRVQVREAGAVAPFGLVGFSAVGIFAVLLLMSFAQSLVLSDQMVALQNEYSAAQVEYASLSAQYELDFDLASIEAAVGTTMIRPTADQVVYLDLSQPDNVVLYDGQATVGGVAGLIEGIQTIAYDLVEYFR